MQRVWIIVLVCGLCFLSRADWQAIGPYGGHLRSVVVSSSGDEVFVCTYTSPTRIAKSTDDGGSWATIGSMPRLCYCLTIDPSNSDNFYAGSYDVVYRSTNGGVHWDSTMMPLCDITGIAVDQGSSSTILASGHCWLTYSWLMTFFKSTDAGVTWSMVHLITGNHSVGHDITISASQPNIIYICGSEYVSGVYHPRVYKSTNGGTSFSNVSAGISTAAGHVLSIAVHPADSNIVYVGTSGDGIYRSIDGGTTWIKVANYDNVHQIVTTSAIPDVAFSSGDSEVYKSTDAGATWSICDTGLSGEFFYGLAMNPVQSSTAYTCNERGIFKTTDAGATWGESNGNINLACVDEFTNAASAPSIVYTVVSNVGVYRTTNSGASWVLLTTPSTCEDITALITHNTNPDIVYGIEKAGTGNSELYKSTDGGMTWSVLDNYYDYGGTLAADPNNNSVYWSGGSHDTLGFSVMTVSKTTDSGLSWSRYHLAALHSCAYALAVDPSNSSIVYAGGSAGLCKTTNGGNSWQDVTGSIEGSVQDIVICPNTTILYVGTSDNCYKSTNGGASWINLGCPDVSAIVVDPLDENTVYVGTVDGVYKSTSAGGNWTVINEGLENTTITSLGIDPDNYLFAGTEGAGMYYWNLQGTEEAQILTEEKICNVQPNPARSDVTFSYRLFKESVVRLSVFDIQGRMVSELFSGVQGSGVHAYTWHGVDEKNNCVSAGIYFIQLKAGSKTQITKFTFLR